MAIHLHGLELERIEWIALVHTLVPTAMIKHSINIKLLFLSLSHFYLAFNKSLCWTKC